MRINNAKILNEDAHVLFNKVKRNRININFLTKYLRF